MVNFKFHNPTEIIFGKSTENDVGLKIKDTAKKILFHYGMGSIKKTGLYDKIIDSLKKHNIDFIELGGVVPNPHLAFVHEGIELCKNEKIDFILAVGGGSTIDSAKAIALGAKYNGDVWDFFEGKSTPNSALPVGVVLTIPAAGSESSDSTVITKEKGLLKRAFTSNLIRPKFSIMNPELTFTLPFYETACGVSDMLAHIMERYFTTVTHVDVTDRLCEGLMRSILFNAPKLKHDPENYDIRAEIMWASTIAHNDILGTGRIGDWASHCIEHELSAIYDIAHGAGLSIVFPAWMKYQYNVDINKFVQFAIRVMDVDLPLNNLEKTVLESISCLENFYKKMELPTRLSQINIDDKNLNKMVAKVKGRGNGEVGNFKTLSSKDILEIYKLAL